MKLPTYNMPETQVDADNRSSEFPRKGFARPRTIWALLTTNSVLFCAVHQLSLSYNMLRNPILIIKARTSGGRSLCGVPLKKHSV